MNTFLEFIKEYRQYFVCTGIGIFLIYIGKLWQRFIDIEKDMPFMKTDLHLMRKLLSQLVAYLKPQVNIPDAFIQTLSPTSLTASGKIMLDKSGLKTIIDNRLKQLKKKIETYKPATNYDIENFCYEVLVREKDQEYMKPVKEYAYNNGIDLINMLSAASIYLRDLVISKNEEK